MKNETRYMIAGLGLAVIGFAACFGFVHRQVKEYNAMMDERRELKPVTYWMKCNPIEIENPISESEIEYLNEPDVDTVQMEAVVTEVEPEPAESESDYVYAPPFHLTEYETWFVECVVAGEAGGEPYEGKLAVAQCYFDAMLKDGLSATEVKSVYGYTGWNEDLDKQDRKAYDEVKNAVADIFYGGKFVTDKPILFFYNPAIVYSGFHEAQNLALEIGGHRFFYLAEDVNAEWTNILLTNANEYGMIEP